jgi:hypothetical protein
MASPEGPLVRKLPEMAKQIHNSIGDLQNEEEVLTSFLLSPLLQDK